MTLGTFGQVLWNAIEHAPRETTVRAELMVDISRERGRLFFCITDQGPGVPAAILERIFQPFIRADPSRSRSTGGVGLGLAIIRRCMETHHGGAEARPGPDGRGLRMELWLPLPVVQRNS